MLIFLIRAATKIAYNYADYKILASPFEIDRAVSRVLLRIPPLLVLYVTSTVLKLLTGLHFVTCRTVIV